ncbi:MAG TPA: hypothetical protein DCZ94_08580 [Lentisphaeria bacterium]|nr:MAG: hypothetical protein A2X48_12350 [Lentisphaerae bacterium GWF2_49_21]HBC86994.1 hypothetical protein [Lentisphaeria bacterium]
MKTRRNQGGQAIVELTVSLVMLLAMFCGFILIAQLATKNVENIITARGEADENGYMGSVSDNGNPILSWNEGADTYLYTADDQAVIGTSDNPSLFSGELKNDEYDLKAAPDYVQDNFSKTMGTLYIFLDAANLTSGNETSSVSLDDLSRMLYVDSSTITLEDTVYMPYMSDF